MQEWYYVLFTCHRLETRQMSLGNRHDCPYLMDTEAPVHPHSSWSRQLTTNSRGLASVHLQAGGQAGKGHLCFYQENPPHFPEVSARAALMGKNNGKPCQPWPGLIAQGVCWRPALAGRATQVLLLPAPGTWAHNQTLLTPACGKK
jgi:hypothetical protein